MRNFTATVKERQVDQPCFVALEMHSKIGLPNGCLITLNLPDGTGIDEARAVANVLNQALVSVELA